MTLDANSLGTNLFVTAMVAFLVIVLPWADRKICRSLRLYLEGGLSENPDADRLLRLRQRLLEREPSIQSVRIIRELPDTLYINLVERTPVALVNKFDSPLVLDSKTILMKKVLAIV